MKITIERNEEQLALVKAMGSSNREESYEAQAAVAKLMAPVLSEVINNAVTVGNLYSTFNYEEDDNPSLPLDLYHDITDEDYIQVYSQQVAGGLPYSQVFPAHNELKFQTYFLDSAWAFDKKYAKRSRLDVLSKTFTRLLQEMLLKQERSAFNVMAGALVNASTKSAAGGSSAKGNHIIEMGTKDRFLLDDFNRLITLSKRINSSFSSGTPVGGSKVGVTDLLASPEMIQSLRAMAYNPINTKGSASVSTAGHGSENGLAAPDELRAQLYSAAGLPSFYGINILEVLEMGLGQRFNKLFDAILQANDVNLDGWDGAATNEILIGVDRTRDALVRPAAVSAEAGTEVSVMVDDQFSVRQNKIGYYTKIEEGRIILDDRALVGIFTKS